MSDQIILSGITAIGFHGVFPEERKNGQSFTVDLKLSFDLAPAGESDDLTKTVNYASVAEVTVEEITGDPVSLIEALATRISKRLFQEFSLLESVVVTVHKPEAPVSVKFSDISVSIERHR
ncbi:MAG: dihydroneopterin aldolase [Actinomycetes bacterium]|tara:strand:+ start:411 stop:773 length:363 start_codon:yes stop_codon:yes gene_type:complete